MRGRRKMWWWSSSGASSLARRRSKPSAFSEVGWDGRGQVRLCSAGSGPVAQLLHLASHRVFGQGGFVEVGPPIDVAVRFRSDFFVVISTFIFEKPADKCELEVNDRVVLRCGAECTAAVLLGVDERRRRSR